MKGLITERHWDLMEKVLPGIRAFYEFQGKELPTFLALEQAFLNAIGQSADSSLLDEYFKMASIKDEDES